jgi:hypothetical protein
MVRDHVVLEAGSLLQPGQLGRRNEVAKQALAQEARRVRLDPIFLMGCNVNSSTRKLVDQTFVDLIIW